MIAIWLTEQEFHRTQTGFQNALTLKLYLFQTINYYAAIFYIAFFKGRFVGTPGNYHTYENILVIHIHFYFPNLHSFFMFYAELVVQDKKNVFQVVVI